MLDTNVFNEFVNGAYNLSELTFDRPVFATHVQRDELGNTVNPDRRVQLMMAFRRIIDDVAPTESFVLDTSKLDQARIGQAGELPTESAVWGISQWGQSKWGQPDSLLSKLRARLNQKTDSSIGKSRNRKVKEARVNDVRDALIAETAIRNHLILVTNDIRLQSAVGELGGQWCRFDDFLTSANMEELPSCKSE